MACSTYLKNSGQTSIGRYFTENIKLDFTMRTKKRAATRQPAVANGLEVKSQLGRQRPRRHVMRAAEGRKKVVQRVLVGDVDGRQLQADFVLVAMKHIVVSHGNVEETARRNAWRILVVVLRIWGRHLQ